MIEQTEHVMRWARNMNEAAYADDAPIAVARCVRLINDALAEIAGECVELGIRQGLTQKALADALGVPPSVLRGAKREFSRS